MSYKWPLVKLDNIKAHTKYSCVGGPFGSSLSRKHYTEEGVPVLRGVNLGSDQFFDSDFVCVSKEKAAELHRNMAYPNDVVFTQRGTLGQVAIIPKNARYSSYVVSQSQMKLTVNSEIAHPYYIYSFFRTDKAKQQIETHAIVGGVPHINLGILKALEIPLPPLNIQKKIVNIIRSIDQKITLNTQTNQTLEEMAQAIFKSWFVDFDPVKAKMNGEQPEGMDAATASLFPEKLVESELGFIPEGWAVKPLDEIAHFENGLALQKFRPESDDDEFLPVLKISHLRQGYCDDKEKARADIKESCRVYDGDMIFSWSGTLMIDLWTGGNAALNQHLFKVTSIDYNLPLYLFWTKHHLTKFQQIAKDKAVTMGHIKRGHLSESLCLIPPKELRDKLDELLIPLINQGLNLRLQSKQLANLLDILLPKLLSGEVDLGKE
tara:strand:+ start:6088 stop:7389 length:1302 start_codon:yes stop_codon:yes gene_type:complete